MTDDFLSTDDHYMEKQFTDLVWCHTNNITRDSRIRWSRRQCKNHTLWPTMRTYRYHQQIGNGNKGSVVIQDTLEEPAKIGVKIANVYVNIFFL